MGLDMYARTLAERPERPIDFKVPGDIDSGELHYWRKHPDLHGWMEDLYRRKGGNQEFNCVNVLIEAEDLDALHAAVDGEHLPHTDGFFFGTSQPEDRDDTLLFIAKARKAIAAGNAVYYTSWW